MVYSVTRPRTIPSSEKMDVSPLRKYAATARRMQR